MAFQAGAIVSKLTLDRSKFSASIKAVQKQTRSLGGWVKKNSAQFKRMGMAITAMGAAALLVFKKMVKQYVEVGDMVHKMALRTGFAAETLSELAYAADISGADLTMLEKGVKKMSKTIVDASYGLETYLRVFRSLGLEIDDLLKMKPEDQFLTIGAAIAEMESDTLRTAAAVDVFGRSGTMLLPMFKEGAEGIAILREEAHRLGIIFDEEMAASAAALKDAQTALTGSVKGLSTAILKDLIPVITEVTKDFTDWFVESRKGAKSWANAFISFFKIIAEGIKGLMVAWGSFKIFVFEMGDTIVRHLALLTSGIVVVTGYTKKMGILGKTHEAAKTALKDLITIGISYSNEVDDQIEKITDIIIWFDKLATTLDKIKTKTKDGKEETKSFGAALEGEVLPPIRDLVGILKNVVTKFKEVGYEGKKAAGDIAKTWQSTMEEILAGAGSFVVAMDSLFGQLHANEATRIDNEEKKKTDAIESWFESERERIERTITDEEELVAALEGLDEEKARKENELQHKMDLERRKLEQARAKSQKASALFSAGINVAEAITKALTAGPLIGQIFAGIVAALGAVQMAAIAAAPLPALAKGGRIGDAAIVGERGPELFMPGTPGTIIPLSKEAGANVNFNFYAPIMQTTGIAHRDVDGVVEYFFFKMGKEAKRYGVKLNA